MAIELIKVTIENQIKENYPTITTEIKHKDTCIISKWMMAVGLSWVSWWTLVRLVTGIAILIKREMIKS